MARMSQLVPAGEGTILTARGSVMAFKAMAGQTGPQDFVLVPRGAAHTFGNGGDQPARLLVLHAPAMDAYFADLDALWSRPDQPTPDEERALMARYGMEPG